MAFAYATVCFDRPVCLALVPDLVLITIVTVNTSTNRHSTNSNWIVFKLYLKFGHNLHDIEIIANTCIQKHHFNVLFPKIYINISL
jgi:hypothetical protein